MNLAFFRLPDWLFCEIIIAVFISWFIGYIPNWQKTAYQKTEAASYEKCKYIDKSGFPAKDDYPQIKSIADTNNSSNFVITIDRKNLKETYVYRSLHEGVYTKNKIMRALLNNEMENGMGQFFIATLESGERIIVLLDDTTIELPNQGEITLPVGKRIDITPGTVFSMLIQKEEIEGEAATFFIDMGSAWRESKEAEEGYHVESVLAISFVVIMILENLILFKVILRKKER